MNVFDSLQAIVWSGAYILMIVYSAKNMRLRKPTMPPVAGLICFAWELNAILISGGLWIHVVWLALDSAIFLLNVFNFRSLRGKACYCVAAIGALALFYFLFRVPSIDIMLYSSFLLDLFISVSFVVRIKHLLPNGRVWISLLRLVGDFFAFLAYSEFTIVQFFGPVILILNLFYLSMCFSMGSVKNAKHR
ncbi:MAG: hypothetical protein IKL89_04730 [Clostridia bacterium]|nr:hypothetical protein [Clostridia bacterium]